jgi:threonine/homoserine/homoserine lactone efflux protein
MPGIDTLLTFAIALFFLEVSPGPDMMLILGRGLGQGRKIASLTVLGMVFVAGFVQIGLLVLGSASLLQAFPSALTALRWVGAAYLIYLGAWLIGWSLGGRKRALTTPEVSAWSAVREGAINSLTNSKSLMFMFAFLPNSSTPLPVRSGLVAAAGGRESAEACLFSLDSVAVASGAVGGWLDRWPRLVIWQERFTGLVMIGLVLRLLVSTNTNSPPPLRT